LARINNSESQGGDFYVNTHKRVSKSPGSSNNFQSVTDVTKYLKDIFKDVIQELLEAELKVNLGYSKEDPGAKNTDNSRNRYSPKTLKSEF